MKIAVKFYKDYDHPKHPKPEGIPDEWPWLCKELKNDELCPVGWTSMTDESLKDYKAKYQQAYDDYIAKYALYEPKPLPQHNEWLKAIARDMHKLLPDGECAKLCQGCEL